MDFFSRKKSIFSLGIVILAILITAFFTIDTLRLQEYDSVRINLSGRQRMLSQKMTKEILLYNSGGGSKNAVLSTVEVFDITLLALKDGGDAPLDIYMAKFETIPEMENKETKDQLEKIVIFWSTFKQKIESVLENNDASSMNYIIDNNTKLLNEIDASVVMMQQNAEEKITRFYWIIAFGILVSIVILMFVIIEETKRKYIGQLENRIKERTRELEEAKQIAEAASQAKEDFLHSASHELRTPLNAVIGFSEILQEQYFGELNEQQAEYVSDILGSGKHLLLLVNDILGFSQIEASKFELELSEMNIEDLLERSMAVIKEKALAHRISLDIDTMGGLEGLEIMADERRLKQVMFNLLSNAAKFTPDGGAIRIEGKKEGEELIISVSDTGVGIAPEEQEKIFEEFYQTSGGIKDKTPGIGLGLPVAKSIIETHGGRIWIESEGQDKGSRFTFTIPIKHTS